MRRATQKARDTAHGDLVVGTDGTRMRVTSVQPLPGGDTVLIHGQGAAGGRGETLPADHDIVRLD